MKTFDQIYDGDSVLNFVSKIEIKRKKEDGTYEATWSDISDYSEEPVITSDSIKSLSMTLPNDSYNFGLFQVPDCTLSLLSKNGIFAGENERNSIWRDGFIRHETLVKISQGYKDDLSGQVELVEVYRGFINDLSTKTIVGKDNITQNLQIEDLLTFLLKKYTYADFSPTETILEDLVYEIMNRPEFTDFLTIDQANITAGFNIPFINHLTGSDPTWEGQTQILSFLEGLSLGLSVFYQHEGIFYFKPMNDTTNQIRVFKEDRIIRIDGFERGIDKVYDSIYWENTILKWQAPIQKYVRGKTIDMLGVLVQSEREDILELIGQDLSTIKKSFSLTVPLYPNIKLTDKISLFEGYYLNNDPFILAKSILGQDYLRPYFGARFIDDGELWRVVGIRHDFKGCKTVLKLKETN